MIKLWIDDIRPAPNNGYIWCKSVNQAKNVIQTLVFCEKCVENDFCEPDKVVCLNTITIELIDIDHDAGDYVSDGGDYIKLLDWLEEVGLNYPIHIHSMNPVGVENMRRIIQRNNWKEIY